MTFVEILALCAMGLFALGIFSFIGYMGFLLFWSGARPKKKLPDRIANGGKLLVDPDQEAEAPELVLKNDRSQYNLAEVARSIGFQVGSPTEPRLREAVEALVHRAYHKNAGQRSRTTYSATPAVAHDIVSRGLGEGTITVCNLEWVETIDPSNSPPRSYDRGQTLVLYETPPNKQLPTFGMMKRSQELSRWLPLLRVLNWGAFREAWVPDDAEFTANVYVATKTPRAVVPLLAPSLRKIMLSNPDLLVNASGRYLAISSRHSLIPCLAWERSAFLRNGQAIAAAVAERL